MSDFELTMVGVEYYKGHRVDLDGQFLDVSPLCRHHRKRFWDWKETDDGKASIALAEKLTGKSVDFLIRGSRGRLGRIFVHRYLWYEVARWVSDDCKEFVWRLIDKYAPDFVRVALGELPPDDRIISTATLDDTVAVPPDVTEKFTALLEAIHAPKWHPQSLAMILAEVEKYRMDAVMFHISAIERMKRAEFFEADMVPILARCFKAYRLDGTCLFTGLPILTADGAPRTGAWSVDHDKSRRALFGNATPMHWIYNERLFDPGPDLTYYDTHAAWRQHRRDWFKHQATDVERRVIRYHIDRVARSAEGKQRWLEARCDEHRRVEHAEGEDAEAS